MPIRIDLKRCAGGSRDDGRSALQGSGKNTTTAKIAKRLTEQGQAQGVMASPRYPTSDRDVEQLAVSAVR